MLPISLRHDIEKVAALRDFGKSHDYVLEQIPLRKDWKSARGKDDMDIGAAESEVPDEDGPVCQPCPTGNDDADLNTMKGGPFQGYCSYCWMFGHKRQDCRKRMAAEKGGGSAPKGGGKDSGGKVGKGDKGEEKGSWQSNGCGWLPKGWQQKGGKGNKAKAAGGKEARAASRA